MSVSVQHFTFLRRLSVLLRLYTTKTLRCSDFCGGKYCTLLLYTRCKMATGGGGGGGGGRVIVSLKVKFKGNTVVPWIILPLESS